MSDTNNADPNIQNEIKSQVALMKFVTDLIDEKKPSYLNDTNRQAVVESLLEDLNEEIDRHLVNQLDESTQKELEKLLDNKEMGPKELDDFMAKSIPNIESEVAAVMLNFRDAYLSPLVGLLSEDPKKVVEEVRQSIEKAEESKEPNELTPAPPAPVESQIPK